MGTPDFAIPALRALHEAGHAIAAVYSQPPKPSGRGHHIHKSPVHLYAEAQGIPVLTPRSLRGTQEQDEFARLGIDCAVVAAYGLILPQPMLDAPRLGCVNIHASLLPRWRGAAPIHRAILAGDSESGITIMKMDAGLDTGAMLSHRALPIAPAMTAGALHDALAILGAALIAETLPLYAAGKITPEPQPESGVTYAAKLKKEEGAVDWSQPADAIERQIRGFQPWPGTWFKLGDENIKLLAAEIMPDMHAAPGTLLGDAAVACGKDALRLITVQRPGKAPVSGADFINGLRLKPGAKFDNG
ncbi:MAG: methionyl-tRNA formyltransferase [Alphaproteobacteria bacterium]